MSNFVISSYLFLSLIFDAHDLLRLSFVRYFRFSKSGLLKPSAVPGLLDRQIEPGQVSNCGELTCAWLAVAEGTRLIISTSV